MSAVRGLRPMVLAIAVTLCAAALVLYYQHRALTTLESQTGIILKQVAEQAASDIAVEARRTLDGPLYETLTAVNHPELRAGRLDLVARQFQEGLGAYPHVDRFFVWSDDTQAAAPGEAVFVDRAPQEQATTAAPPVTVTVTSTQPPLRFVRDPELGRAIIELARHYAPEQHIYVAAQGVGPRRLQALLRLFWTDARRESYFAILGFVVDPATSGQRLFDALDERSLKALLARRGGDTPLGLRVVDEHGRLVHGEPAPFAQAATAMMPMLFYPWDRVDSRLSGGVEPRPWRIEVSADTSTRVASVSQGYWPTLLSVLLMLVALGLTLLANQRLADLTKMQADFISHVSHQLKTPLSLLSAAMETVTMDRARSPEKLQQYLGIMGGEVARLSSLVQRVLEYSRLQQQRGFEFEAVDLRPLVHETVSAFESSLSARQFRFRVEEPSPPKRVNADPAAIEQALVNLLDNAVKYSGEARDITVRLHSLGNAAVIEVIDYGIGISKEDQRHIFERFYRGAGGLVDRNGFGLGLPIVNELIHAHGGRVEVDSQPGKGSTFRVILPTLRERSGEIAPEAPNSSGVRHEAQPS